MIKVTVRITRAGLLRELTALGHAGRFDRNGSMTCLAASVLLRTTAEALAERFGPGFEVEAPEAGELKLGPIRPRLRDRGWLKGATQVLLTGLRDLAEDSDEIELIVIE